MPTAARAAKNESLFREVNEAIADLQADFEARAGVDFVCGCARLDCTTRIDATLDEYAAVRAEPTHFLLVAGHVNPEHETIIRANDRHCVVEKIGAAGKIAEEEAA